MQNDDKHDWDMFEEVIMGGFPTGNGISSWDLILYYASLYVADVDVAEDSELNPRNFLVGRIFEKVRKRVVQDPAC